MYCKYSLYFSLSSQFKVLIVAKCIVNYEYADIESDTVNVLIVAKCIVNPLNLFS